MVITTRKQVMRIGQLGSKWGRKFTMFGKCLDFSFFKPSLMTSNSRLAPLVVGEAKQCLFI